MRKLILSIFIVLFCAFQASAWNPMVVSSGNTSTNGAIGKSSVDLQYDGGYVNYVYHTKFTTTTAGTVSYGHVYIENDGTSMTLCIGLYDASGNKLVTGTQATSLNGNGWINIALDSSYDLVAATNYYLGVQSSATKTGLYDYAGSGGNGLNYDSIGSYNCSVDPINPEETTTAANGKYTIYFDNNSGDPS